MLSKAILYYSTAHAIDSHPKKYNSVPVQRQVDKAGFGGEIDRSLNVVVFGVPESKDLLGTEALVSI